MASTRANPVDYSDGTIVSAVLSVDENHNTSSAEDALDRIRGWTLGSFFPVVHDWPERRFFAPIQQNRARTVLAAQKKLVRGHGEFEIDKGVINIGVCWLIVSRISASSSTDRAVVDPASCRDPVVTTHGWAAYATTTHLRGLREAMRQRASIRDIIEGPGKRGDCGSTSPRSLDELAHLRTHTAHYSQ